MNWNEDLNIIIIYGGRNDQLLNKESSKGVILSDISVLELESMQ